ncbi:hypothetical protein [Galactobacter sp.]|uniref:hypothetical protein n=1 Tax=Galactobacter sp. TaxID=2676125 RepID=UPI0025C1F5B8|nr:hypothetical protein [Galactobacter sp.]
MAHPLDRPVLLAIDGRSGSGKTSLAAALQRALAAQHHLDVEVFHVEDTYRGWEGLQAGVDHYVQAVLPPLHRGETATWHAWDWAAGRVETTQRVARPASVVICEGVGAACKQALPMLDAALTLDVPADHRKQRALARDGETYRPYWDVWAAQEDDFLRDQETVPEPARGLDLTLAPPTTADLAATYQAAETWALQVITSTL